jgi:LacI family transcriptional regulator
MQKEKKELVGVKEIARRANVSIATVDRVLHNRTGVSKDTKEKINAIIKELDYQPNLLARRLASARTLHLVTLIPMVSKETDYWAVPLEGIFQAESEIKPYDVKITKFFYDMNDRDSFVKQAELILKEEVDGILLAPAFIEETIEFTNACQKRKIPFVFINSDIPNQKSLCYYGPNLFHSGYSAAHLINYLIHKEDKILLVNISKEIELDHHILRKEEGFMAYFNKINKKTIVKLNIRQTDYASVKKQLSESLVKHPDIKLIFVTNSRVSKVAQYLESIDRKDILLIGYDLLKNNIEYLKKDIIDFLVCEKPQEQAYRGIRTLYQYLVFNLKAEKEYFMPIDIIHKENYEFYRN